MEIIVNGRMLPFQIGQKVFLITDPDQMEHIITGIKIRPDGITYALAFGASENWCYAIEISKERNVVKATSN
jgi:hypothetical protein